MLLFKELSALLVYALHTVAEEVSGLSLPQTKKWVIFSYLESWKQPGYVIEHICPNISENNVFKMKVKVKEWETVSLWTIKMIQQTEVLLLAPFSCTAVSN